MTDSCPFCQPPAPKILDGNEHALILGDGFPVSEGHLLVCTRRHVADWFAATEAEHRAILELLHRARSLILARHAPAGFNIGVNVGMAAGQTVMHLHVHLIPRYPGEFHHATARTYRRLIDYFTPKFLLGLTATPERTDGGDLLALCQENLVFRKDLVAGIEAGLLCPFQYFGVPDEVDYSNIPWRRSRFDEQELTKAVATTQRAENALEQYRKRAGQRTLAFCCSQRHADFMLEHFVKAGVKAVAVHSGPTSAPRASTLESLADGRIEVIFAVDMFNEGLDLPNVDTVLMLRPTESTILWQQQFGRGLRRSENKAHLRVIDYIGNHRSFLVKIRALLEPLFENRRVGCRNLSRIATPATGACGTTARLRCDVRPRDHRHHLGAVANARRG